MHGHMHKYIACACYIACCLLDCKPRRKNADRMSPAGVNSSPCFCTLVKVLMSSGKTYTVGKSCRDVIPRICIDAAKMCEWIVVRKKSSHSLKLSLGEPARADPEI